VEDAIQIEMAKIAVIKANIVRTTIACKDTSLESIEKMMKELESWYNELPEVMTLQSLQSESVGKALRRTVLFCHLLHLGAIMLLYRQLSPMLSDPPQDTNLNSDQTLSDAESKRRFILDEGKQAAKHSATILGLLKLEDSIVRRCWITIFQAYISCTVILHTVTRRHADQVAQTGWQEDLEKAEICLLVLEICAQHDLVAKKFHRILSGCYSTIEDSLRQRETSIAEPKSPSSHVALEASTREKDDSFVLSRRSFETLTLDDKTGFVEQSRILQELLCHPFGSADNTDSNVFPEAFHRVGFESNSQKKFQWNFASAGIPKQAIREEDMLMQNVFLDSLQPSGWQTSASYCMWRTDN
jgi:hypothetical protein